MKDNYKDIYKLCEKFFEPASAKQMAEDFQQVEALLRSTSAPDVSADTLQSIKQRIRRQLTRTAPRPRRIHLRIWLSAAAAIIMLAAISPLFFRAGRSAMPDDSAGQLTASLNYIWEDSFTASSDPAVSLNTTIEYLAGQADSIQGQLSIWLEDDDNLTSEIKTLETVTSETDFWKG